MVRAVEDLLNVHGSATAALMKGEATDTLLCCHRTCLGAKSVQCEEKKRGHKTFKISGTLYIVGAHIHILLACIFIISLQRNERLSVSFPGRKTSTAEEGKLTKENNYSTTIHSIKYIGVV